jgi:hypothetical protein
MKVLLIKPVPVLIGIAMLAVGIAGAAPVEEWNVTLKGMEYEGFLTPQTSDGGYIITTFTFTMETSFDVWLIKIDANGKEQWRKLFKGQHWDWPGCVQQTKDGGYIFAGFTESHEWGNRDAWLVKTDANGNELWNKRFGGSDADNAAFVQQTEEGGYIIAGATKSFGSGNQDAWLIKTDANGNEQWRKIYGGTGDDGAYSVKNTLDDGYILAGWTDSYGAGSVDAWVIKVDENGNKQWDRTFGGASHEEASSIQQTLDGGYVIAGLTKSYGAGNSDAWLLKIDANGKEQWGKTFGGQNDERAWSVQQTSDGGYILAGSKIDDAWLIKTDANGNELWNKTFGGADPDEAYSIVQTSEGGYAVAGRTRHGFMPGDAWLFKFSSEVTPIPTQALTPTPTITPTPALTPKPAVVATTPKTPGFESALAIAGILAIECMTRHGNRRKQE